MYSICELLSPAIFGVRWSVRQGKTRRTVYFRQTVRHHVSSWTRRYVHHLHGKQRRSVRIKICYRVVKATPFQGRYGQLLSRQPCCLWNVINAVTVGDDKKLQLFVVRFVKNQYLCRDVSFIVLKWQSICNIAVTSSYKVRVRGLSYWLNLVFICRENPRRWGLSLFAERKKVPDRLGFSRHMKTRL